MKGNARVDCIYFSQNSLSINEEVIEPRDGKKEIG